jgi:hypothetical protein
MTFYPRVVLEVDKVCFLCQQEIAAGTLVYFRKVDDTYRFRHINCGQPTKYEARNRVRRKADYHEVMAKIEAQR